MNIAKTLAALVAVGAALGLAPRVAHAHKSCVETGDAVGEKSCGRYGDGWAVERTFPLVAGMGFFHGAFSPAGKNFGAKVSKNGPIVYRFDGAQTGVDTIRTWGFDLRTHAFFTKSLYAGLDWGFAFGHASSQPFTADGWSLQERAGLNVFQFRMTPVLGARVPLGPVSLRAELLGGLHIVSLSHNVSTGGGPTQHGTGTAVLGVIEPRVALDVWTGPWSTMTVWTGVDALRPTDRTFGIAFALHGRAFDGAVR